MNKENFHDMWVYVECENGKLLDSALELCCEVRKLCNLSGEALCAVSVTKLCNDDMEKLFDCGINKLIIVSGRGYEHYNTEAFANLFTVLCRSYRPSAVFVSATANGRDFAPRFAARLETGCTSDATELIFNPDTGDIEFVEPAAGGKIMAVITIPKHRPQVATIRPGTFLYAPAGREEDVEIIEENIHFDNSKIRVEFIESIPDKFDPELNISACSVIICLGAGLKDESLPMYRRLAELMGGKIACTRPLVDRDLMPYKLQVGQSGVVIKPKLYIGFGISGAVNHVIGVKADMFVAVNKDPSAPIFNYCDYGIVGDMDKVCSAMIDALSKD